MILSIVKPNSSTRERLYNCEVPGTVSPSATPYHKQLIFAKCLEVHRGKKENTHTALASSSLCLARLAVLSLAFAVIPSLSPNKFQSTPLPEAPIYLNRWEQNYCISQSAVAAELAYKAIPLQVSVKNVQRGISGCRGARTTQQPFVELRCWQRQKQHSAAL